MDVNIHLDDLTPIGGLKINPSKLPKVKFPKDHPIETARQHILNNKLDMALECLEKYKPKNKEFAICQTIKLIIHLKKNEIKTALYYANELFLEKKTSPHRLYNLLEVALAAEQLYFAEYWSNTFEAEMCDNLVYLKNAILINLRLGNVSKAAKLSEDHCGKLVNKRTLRENEKHLINELATIVSKNQNLTLNVSWKQTKSNILSTKSNKKLIPVFTLPKSGTHYFRNIAKHLSEVDWHIVHVYQYKPLHFAQNKRALTIRDPRSMILSLKNYIDKSAVEYKKNGYVNSPAFDFLKFENWEKLSEEEKLIQIIEANDGESALFTRFYKSSLLESSLMKSSELTHICKFEDLCATKESKISNIQIQTLKDLLIFFELSLADETIADILEKSWGNSATFHKADPFAWKTELPRKIISRIEQKYGYFISDWGYD